MVGPALARRPSSLRWPVDAAYRWPCRSADGEAIHLWSAADALVLKALSLMLAPQLAISPRCTHTRGHGGHKATVADVQRRLPQFRFVLRTDVKDHYASLDHELLLEQLARRIKDRFLMNLLVQYLRRSVDDGGNYREVRRGIARGCALSPMIGAFYLKALDERVGGDTCRTLATPQPPPLNAGNRTSGSPETVGPPQWRRRR